MHPTPSPKKPCHVSSTIDPSNPVNYEFPPTTAILSHQPLPLLPHGAPFRCAVLQGKGHLARSSFFPRTSSLHLNSTTILNTSTLLSLALSLIYLSQCLNKEELFDSDDSGGGHGETAMKPPETSSSIPSAPASKSLPGQGPVKRALGEGSKSSSSKGGGQEGKGGGESEHEMYLRRERGRRGRR